MAESEYPKLLHIKISQLEQELQEANVDNARAENGTNVSIEWKNKEIE